MSHHLHQVISHFRSRSALVTTEWIEQQLQQNQPSTSNLNSISAELYQRFLALNWSDENNSRWLLPSLPVELNTKLCNADKITFNGRYLLQISQIVDIHEPLQYGQGDDSENLDVESDENDEGNENNNFAALFKPRKKLPANGSKQRKVANPNRMFKLRLTDGHHECFAIEYQPMQVLNASLLGAKCLLSGPFDVYVGTIFLKPANLKVVSGGHSPSKPLEPKPKPAKQLPAAQVLTEISPNFFSEDDLMADFSDLD